MSEIGRTENVTINGVNRLKNEKKNKTVIQETYELYHIWQSAAVLLLAFYSISPVKLAGYDAVEGFCILAILALAVLYLLIACTGSAYWIHGITAEMTAKAGKRAAQMYGVRNLVIYIACLFIYLVYCKWSKMRVVSSTTYSAIAGAVILTIAIIVSGKTSLFGKRN